MIVDPDFLDHWRTRMLVDALGGDEMAPMYLMRLWGHCQVRRSDRFDMPPAGLKAQCRYQGDADAFEKALAEGKFIERHGPELEVLGWAEQNASLLAAWENGHKGGRPRKPKQNPRVSMDSGSDDQKQNPDETHGKPTANPSLTQTKPIRVDKRREEENIPPGFARFWLTWPRSERKEAKGKCLEVWVKAGAEAHADRIVAHVERLKVSRGWTKDDGEFIPAPLVYLNQKKWEGADEGAGAWWLAAGFSDQFEAENAGCRAHNAAQFHDGKRDEVAA